MKNSFLTFLIFCGFILQAKAQKVANYYFGGDLKEFGEAYIPLDTLGALGHFENEVVAKLGQKPRPVFVYPQNAGLLFDNTLIKDFIKDSYAIEMYFRYDNGALLLYNQLLGDKLEEKQGKYVHLVMTRDASSKRVLVYLQGEKAMEFSDDSDQLAMDKDSQIVFFAQEGRETTSGAVAMVKIYNYFIDLEESEDLFSTFKETDAKEELSISSGDKMTLEGLYFIQSESILLPESLPTVDRLTAYMLSHENTKVEVQGHTDNQGDYGLNIQLSKKRAEAIKNILIENGIAAKRIKTRGFGGSRPKHSNNNIATRKLNRRVELEVL